MGGIMWAPMNFSMFWQALPFAWLFGVYIKDRWPGWWAKYALIMSSALGVGIALSTLVQFFALTNRDVQVRPRTPPSPAPEKSCATEG